MIDKQGALIFDAQVKKYTTYSREKVRFLVREGLITMLKEALEADGNHFDEIEARDKIERKLKSAFYNKSYKAIIDWAKQNDFF